MYFCLNQKNAATSPIIGRIVIVIRSPALEARETPAEKSTDCCASVVASLLRANTERAIEATRAAKPLASLTTNVCMENTTLSSRLPVFSWP